MNNFLKSKFECLPDEIILEICRYIHCGHILYSFYNLNSRINQAITDYCHHVILRRLNYKQFLYIYSNVLPQIGTFIISLTINRLQQTYFLHNFSLHMNKIFPNLEKLALDDWKNKELFSFIGNDLNQLKYLRTIIIRGLRQTNQNNSITYSNDDQKHLLDIIYKNTEIEFIYFEPDCYSMKLSINQKKFINHSNLIEMSISLLTSNDLISLAILIPNIRRLHVIIEEFLPPINQDIIPFQCLTHFSLNAIDFYSTFDNISSILRLTPTIQQLSLTLTTKDERLIYGQHLFTFLSSQLFTNNKLIQSLKYAVYFSTSVDYYFDFNSLLESWNPISIAYTINKDEKKSYILIHTLPYPSILLNLYSILPNKFGIRLGDQVYNNIQYLCICHAKTLRETFTIIQHCRKIQDLSIQIDKTKAILPVPTNQQTIINLPKLKQLEILSIFGMIDNWQHFKILLIAAHNVSTLCIDLDCAIKLFETIDEDLIFSRVLHLFIDGNNSNVKFKNEHIHSLSKVFSDIHSLKIKYKTENFIETDIISTILDNCKQLIVFTINGQISDDRSIEYIQEWLIEYSSRLKNSDKNYQVDFCDNWFQIWL